MAGTDEVTEITEADFTKVAGVTAPANRVPYVLLKAAGKGEGPDSDATDPNAAPETPFGENVGHKLSDADQEKFKENAERMKEGKKPAKKADAEPHESDTSSPEADAQQDEMTDEPAAKSYCGDPECEPCQKAELIPLLVATAHASGVAKATLRAADRKKMPSSKFAYVDPKGGKHLPIHDEAHVQAAMGRFNQQDFSDADDPDAAKRKAAGKILRAAGKFGMDVDDESNVSQAAKGASQDALNGTAAPEYAGTIDGSKQSIQPATAGVRTDLGSVIPSDQDPSSVPGVIARLRGGQSAYAIPAEEKAYTVSNKGPLGPQIAHVGAAKAVSSLFEAMDAIDAQRNAMKAGNYLQVPGPSDAESSTPGSMPWESYDAATLDQVASVLAQCVNAVECICVREQIEALSNDPSDQQDAWDLQQAQDCLDCAAGIVARLAYAEGAEAAKSAEGDIQKAYSRLRAGDEKALRSAHAALSNVLAEHDRAKAEGAGVEAGSSEPSEGDKIQMELTKEELADQIAASTKKAVEDARKAEAKAAKKAAKAEAKKAERKLQKAAEEEILARLAQKNANNGGDITAQQEQDGVTAEHDADDIQSVGGKPDPKYVTKALKKAAKKAVKKQALAEVKGQLEALSAETQSVGQLVKSFANRPRSGGPVLDGIPRGLYAASEQRLAEGQNGAGESQVIKGLEEQFEKSTDALERQRLGFELTRMKLAKEAAENLGDFTVRG